MKSAQFEIPDEAAMERFGRALAKALPTPIVVALIGDLGAGKTRLVRAMAEAWGVPSEEIGSPTFVLCREYVGSRRAFHLDAYRLTDESELFDLGFEELLEEEAVVLLEWADRALGCLPNDYLKIEIFSTSPESRVVQLTEVGRASGVIGRLG